MKLTINAGRDDLASIDLGEPEGGHFDGGDVGLYQGNLYLYIDGVEYGSLFLTADENGQPQIMLGQFDPNEDWWIEKSVIGPVDAQVVTSEEGN